jgi:hypothetical protein
MNWYRVKVPHDAFHVGDRVLLEGGPREAALEQWGYLEFESVDQGTPPGPSEPQPEFLAEESDTREEAIKPKRGRRRGQSTEAEQVPGEELPDGEGEPVRPEDL